MQEKFLLKTKRFVKQAASLSVGVAMMGATMGGALALDLATDYSKMFENNLAIVVGSVGDISADSLAAIDLMADIQYNAKECTPTSGGTVSVAGGVTEDIPLGDPIADTRSTTLDQELEDDDIDNLFDGVISFQSKDYDVHEELVIGQAGNNVTIQTSLTSSEDDYETNIFMEVENKAIKYYYVFDETIEVNATTASDALKIKFLGKTLKLTSVDSATKFTAYVGSENFLKVGDSVTVDGKTIKLVNVGSEGAIVVEVDGVKATISGSSTETVNGLEIVNDETFYDSNSVAERSATLIIGKDAQESYQDGDPYTGGDNDVCDDNNPNDYDCWEWNIGNLNTASSTTTSVTGEFTGPFIGVENRFVWNDDRDNPATVGECADLPNNFLSVCFDSLTVPEGKYKGYTFEYESSADLSDAEALNTSVAAVHIYTDQIEGIVVDRDSTGFRVNGTSATETKTDEVWLYTENLSIIQVYYEDTNGKIQYAGYVDNGTGTGPIMHINYDNTKSTDVELFVDTGDLESGSDLNITLVPYDSNELPTFNDNITMRWTLGSVGINKLGTTASSEEASELVWGSSLTTIGTKDEDHRTRYGIVVRDPKSNGAGDKVVLDMPNDQVQANIVVKGTASTTSSAAGETCTVKQVTPNNMLSSEVSTPSAYNMVLVGGPCANPLVEDLFGISCSGWSYETGEAVVKLAQNGEKLAMLVAGTTATDTRRAAKAVRSAKVALSGTETVLVTAEETVTVKSA